MSDEDEHSKNEYLDLPDDPEEAFAVLHRRKYNELEEIWSENRGGAASFSERRYVDTLVAFDGFLPVEFKPSYRKVNRSCSYRFRRPRLALGPSPD